MIGKSGAGVDRSRVGLARILVAAVCMLQIPAAVLMSGDVGIRGETAYVIDEKDLIPEGITYSQVRGAFYLGSLNKKKIISIDAATGAYRDFVGDDVLDMLVLGLTVDDARGYLWACAVSAGGPYRSVVAKFDLSTGALLRSFERRDTKPMTANDLVLDTRGNVYYTDPANNSVFRIDAANQRVERIFRGESIERPNGITISPNDRYLYVASGTRGIQIIDLRNRRWLNGGMNAGSRGIDGLKFFKGSLIGIRNGFADREKIRIVRYFLDKDLTRIIGSRVIDRNHPEFDVPTTFVMVGDELFCIANSQLGNFSDAGVRDPSRLKAVKILRYRL